jgi:hypothetical protein
MYSCCNEKKLLMNGAWVPVEWLTHIEHCTFFRLQIRTKQVFQISNVAKLSLLLAGSLHECPSGLLAATPLCQPSF